MFRKLEKLKSDGLNDIDAKDKAEETRVESVISMMKSAPSVPKSAPEWFGFLNSKQPTPKSSSKLEEKKKKYLAT